jgi:RNase adapter protein RapZ
MVMIARRPDLKIRLVSYAIRDGDPPYGADAVFDCRVLPNPYHVRELRDLDGRDVSVQNFVRASVGFDELMLHVFEKAMAANADLVFAFGCLVGRHRSVACAELVGDALSDQGFTVQVEHTALSRLGEAAIADKPPGPAADRR